MCSIYCLSVEIIIPRYFHSVLCILAALTVLFISYYSCHIILTIIYFVFFRPKLIFFSFSILAVIFTFPYMFCFTSCLPAVAMSSINTGILIFILPYPYFTSIYFHFTNAVNCGCFCTANDGSKYCALFYHFFDLCIFCVSYWCSNWYICSFVQFM